FPIFKGFFYRNLEKKAKASLLKSKATLRQKELEVINDVSISYTNLRSSIKNLKYSKEYLKEAKTSFNIAIKNYEAGTNTILDVISSQSSLEDARAKKAKAKRDFLTSISDLAYSTGSLARKE
ncbi:unnamed protein product, partial [marine sediment metagenome]